MLLLVSILDQGILGVFWVGTFLLCHVSQPTKVCCGHVFCAEECRGERLPGALSFPLEFSFFSGKQEQQLKIVATGRQILKIPDANVQKLRLCFP